MPGPLTRQSRLGQGATRTLSTAGANAFTTRCPAERLVDAINSDPKNIIPVVHETYKTVPCLVYLVLRLGKR